MSAFNVEIKTIDASTVKKEIEKLVNRYSPKKEKIIRDLLRADLELLVLLAEREQLRRDHKATMEIIGIETKKINIKE